MLKLRFLNIFSAAVQFVLCCLMVFMLFRPSAGQPIPLISGEYLGGNEGRELAVYNEKLIFGLLLAFCVVTMAVHAFYAGGGKWYTQRVIAGNNSVRWVEYAVTATIMLLVIAFSSGVIELDAQILIAVCSIGCMLCGDLVEKALIAFRSAQGDVRMMFRSSAILATMIGWILLLGAYSVIFRNFTRVATNPDKDRRPPWFVWVIVFLMFAMFSSFGGIQVTHMLRTFKTPSNYNDINMKAEVAYSIDSNVSKSLLVLLLFGGILGRSTDKETTTLPGTGSTTPAL